MSDFTVESVNISEKKGVIKKPVDRIKLVETGIEGDAHAGLWHRQVSLLASESIKKAEVKAGTEFPMGTFAENITTRGVELHKTNILDRFISDDVVLEVTQIGKKCHSTCAIGRKIGNCIMPIEGIFTRVVKGGEISAGKIFKYLQKVFKIRIITLSDRASAGIYEDKSGQKIDQRTREWFKLNSINCDMEKVIIPDDKSLLKKELEKCINKDVDIIFTTGSTGIGPRDIAPEVVSDFIEKELPGIMDLIRVKYGLKNPNAVLSRSVAGTVGKTIIFSLPGSEKAVDEYLNEIFSILFHTILMLHGINKH